MNSEKKRKLEAAGFHETTVSEFLDLSPEDEAWIEMKLALTNRLREVRKEAQLTQAELAQRIGSGQSRVAKMEAGSADVSFDLLIKGLLAAGSTPQEIGQQIGGVPFKAHRSPRPKAPRKPKLVK
jgi:DNA-binding XRE family transcriptional regulator